MFELTAAQTKAMGVLGSDAMHICLGGGSRSGKTFLLLRALVARALMAAGSRHCLFRFRLNSIKASIIHDTLPKVMDLCWPGLRSVATLNRADWVLTLPNQSQMWFGGLDDKERTEKILGQEFATLYFNECSQIPWVSRSMAITRLAQKTDLRLKAYYDLNPTNKHHWVYRMFIEHVDPVSKAVLDNPENYAYFRMNPMDNLANLPPEYLEELQNLSARDRKRFLEGDFADVSEGELWNTELLELCRIKDSKETPDMQRVVIAVDPSGCKGEEDERSDEVGIVVVGLGVDGKGYLLNDASGKMSPVQWGKRIAELYNTFKADLVLGESNYGGAMVEAVIRAANPNVKYLAVNATRGKVVRAEPISALYEQNKVRHVGHYIKLEDQLCMFTVSGYTGETSPDRADALIWALTHFFTPIVKSQTAYDVVAPKVIAAPRCASRHSSRLTPRVRRQRSYV